MTTSLPVVFASLGKVIDLDPRTPLVSALATRLQQGTSLLEAIRGLMGESGLLANVAANVNLADAPFIRDALERLRAAGLILMEPGEQNIRLTTLSEQAEPDRSGSQGFGQSGTRPRRCGIVCERRCKARIDLDGTWSGRCGGHRTAIGGRGCAAPMSHRRPCGTGWQPGGAARNGCRRFARCGWRHLVLRTPSAGYGDGLDGRCRA